MMVLAHNLISMCSNRQLGITKGNKGKTSEKLSSGYRINRSSDDAAGLAISEKLRSQVRGLMRGAMNLQDGINMCNTADSALGEVHNILHRMRELAVQGCNDAIYTESDRVKLNDEVQQLKKEIDRISVDTEFNNKKLLCEECKVSLSDVVEYYGPTVSDPYGGIIILGDQRYSWRDIDSSLASIDSNTGEVIFHSGSFEISTSAYTLRISSSEGTSTPRVNAEYTVTASSSGISTMGKTIPWSAVKDTDGVGILDYAGSNMKGGKIFGFSIGNGTGMFFASSVDSIADVAASINFKKKKDRWVQAGANEGEGFNLDWDGISTFTLGIVDGQISGFFDSSKLLGSTDNAIDKVSQLRGVIGAYVNRMEFSYNNDKIGMENQQAAESRIRDTDMADEMTQLSKQNILEQAGTAMLSQANQSTQLVMLLFQ